MNKKNMIIGLITGVLLLTGCGEAANQTNTQKNIIINSTDNTGDAVTSNINDDTVSNSNDMNFESVGEVLSISDGLISVLEGDIVRDFKVFNDDLKHIYIGQTVSITKETETDYSVMAYNIEDFVVRHTSMGDLIDRVSGEVVKLEEGIVTIMLSDGETIKAALNNENLLASIAESLNFPEPITYEFDIVKNDSSSYIMAAYNLDYKLSLTIDELTKTDNHTLEILASDKDGAQFYLDTASPVKNFNLHDLVVGQTIEVFVNLIMESSPAQVEASRIDLTGNLPTGVTAIDYDLVGDVISIKGNEVHILSGDLAEIFNIDEEQLQAIHLGERVMIYSKEGKLTIEPFIIKDFSTRFTNMGQLIEPLNGIVSEIEVVTDGHIISIKNEDQITKAYYYGEVLPLINTYYEFEFVSYLPGDDIIFNFYNPETIVSMTVTALNRSENGELLFNATDTGGGEYVIGTSSATINFNISELKIGDVLNVYADAIMESWPMQVQTTRILKVQQR